MLNQGCYQITCGTRCAVHLLLESNRSALVFIRFLRFLDVWDIFLKVVAIISCSYHFGPVVMGTINCDTKCCFSFSFVFLCVLKLLVFLLFCRWLLCFLLLVFCVFPFDFFAFLFSLFSLNFVFFLCLFFAFLLRRFSLFRLSLHFRACVKFYNSAFSQPSSINFWSELRNLKHFLMLNIDLWHSPSQKGKVRWGAKHSPPADMSLGRQPIWKQMMERQLQLRMQKKP